MIMIPIKTKLFSQEIMCLETPNNMILNHLKNKKIKLKYILGKAKNSNHKIIIIKVSKRYLLDLINALKEMDNKFLLCGYPNYEKETMEYFTKVWSIPEEGLVKL